MITLNQILTIMDMSRSYGNGKLVRIFKRSHSEIARIVKGYAIVREDDGSIDRDLIKQLGFTICGCCRERIIVRDPSPDIRLSRMCIYCFKTVSTDGEHGLYLPARYN